MSNILEINNLVVKFKTDDGEVEAVRNVSLNLKKGETLAIVGESGCGKSVLCKSIIKILPQNAYIEGGEVILRGEDLTKVSQKYMNSIRGKDISMIFQDPMTALNPTISIGKQILEAILIHNKINKQEAKKRAIELINLVGIDNPEKRFKQYPHHFSGGMRQRIVIAIALACNPSVLIADEPTTALDVTIQAQIIDLMKDLQKKIGVSIIFITHDLGVVAEIADRVAVMYAGKIVEIGTVEDIFYNSKHPYTWGLMSSLPTLESENEFLYNIPGEPPNLINPPKGDAFAIRNQNALKIDYFEEPPMFKISDTHSASTWLLYKDTLKIKTKGESVIINE
ncbi:ABC transporter ATP-binding protein [Romboutsia sedimentorum]|uniref:ABC transporter ATP-binding protein n=1 Tax=Romboutsia sedimentorum TaxID=1368474 RepID=A0ABT7ED62_9FIRM|nr:ABC transporter ATP-binding protein [Romboutsia sedimentorum]MDK2564871.1 ABC transporter ATP-binding protein [Romboutsia sedimentorum]MDK2587016.1 ABC transporter ATP-binding protein [Romboutsia sedimentorum]